MFRDGLPRIVRVKSQPCSSRPSKSLCAVCALWTEAPRSRARGRGGVRVPPPRQGGGGGVGRPPSVRARGETASPPDAHAFRRLPGPFRLATPTRTHRPVAVRDYPFPRQTDLGARGERRPLAGTRQDDRPKGTGTRGSVGRRPRAGDRAPEAWNARRGVRRHRSCRSPRPRSASSGSHLNSYRGIPLWYRARPHPPCSGFKTPPPKGGPP